MQISEDFLYLKSKQWGDRHVSIPLCPGFAHRDWPLQDGKVEEPQRAEPPDLRHWQIEEFLRQAGKAIWRQ